MILQGSQWAMFARRSIENRSVVRLRFHSTDGLPQSTVQRVACFLRKLFDGVTLGVLRPDYVDQPGVIHERPHAVGVEPFDTQAVFDLYLGTLNAGDHQFRTGHGCLP